MEALQLARQSPLDSWDHAGGPTVARRSDGQEAAPPQMSYCLAAVSRFTSSDGNIGGLKFRDQLMNKLTRKLKRLDLAQVAKKPSIVFLAEDEDIRQNSIDKT